MTQLSLSLEPPTTTGRGRPPAVPAADEGRDPHYVLEEWCEDKECMIFLWGKNPHICAARAHSLRDPGIDRWVERKRAEEILSKHGYRHTSDQSVEHRHAKVYTR